MRPSPRSFLFATMFLDALGIGIVYPVMPELIEELGHVGIGGAAVWGGVLATAYALMQFLCAPVLGALSDRYGRRPVLLLALGVMAVDYLGSALAQSIWVLLALRLLAGVTAATHATCNAALADLTPPDRRAQAFGLLNAAFLVGFILGPVLGGFLGQWSPRAPFWAAAALAGAGCLLGWLVLPETVAPEARRPLDLGRANPLGAFRSVARLRGARGLLAILFLTEVAYTSYGAIWTYWARAAFGWSPLVIGLSLAAWGVGAALTQGWGIRLYLRWFGERGTILAGILVTLLFLVIFGLIPAGPAGAALALLLCPFSALGEVILPAIQGRLSRAAPDDAQGETLGVVAATRSAAVVAGPLVMTGIFAWSVAPGGPGLLGAPYLLGAALMALCLALFLRMPAGGPTTATS